MIVFFLEGTIIGVMIFEGATSEVMLLLRLLLTAEPGVMTFEATVSGVILVLVLLFRLAAG